MANRIGFTDTLTGKETVLRDLGNGGSATTSARSGIRKGCLPDEKLPVL